MLDFLFEMEIIMKRLDQFLNDITSIDHREKISNILTWVQNNFPELTLEFKWNQPMFLHHGTYIIAFSVAKAHFAFSPEQAGIVVFKDEAELLGYKTSKMLIKVKWTDEVNYEFIRKVIEFNMNDKIACKSFWRS